MCNALSFVTRRLREAKNGHLLSLDTRGEIIRISYRALADEVEAFKQRLQKAGIGRGHQVGLVGPNCKEWVVADLALLDLGCISVCLTEEMVRQEGFEPLSEYFELVAIVVPTRREHAGTPSWTFCVSSPEIEAAIRTLKHTRDRAGNEVTDAYSLVFSSGTTGKPKCLKMSGRGIANTINVSELAWRVTRADNLLIALPFSSVQQRTLVYLSITCECDCTVVPPQHLYRALAAAAPTILVGPPAIFEQFERDLSDGVGGTKGRTTPLRSWLGNFRLMIVGSAPSKNSTLEFFSSQGLPLYEVYGMNEFGWIAFNLPGASRTGSVGRIVEGVETRIADDGELLVRGRARQAISYVYVGKEENKDVYGPDGWIRTGDRAALDQDGFLTLIGRKKNVIIRRTGEKLQPESIEARIEEVVPYIKAMIFEDLDHHGLACVVWVPPETKPDQRVQIPLKIGEISRTLGPSFRIGTVLMDSTEKLTSESGLLTRNGKLSRGAVIASYAESCKGKINAPP